MPDSPAPTSSDQDWGYVRVAGIVGQISWDDAPGRPVRPLRPATGWGLNLSSNVKVTSKDTLRLQFAFGEGIQNYMNDSPVDIGPRQAAARTQ